MIETERLLLRHWKESDAVDLFRYAGEPRVSELAMWPCHTSVAMSLGVIREVFMPNLECYAIVNREGGEAIGCVGLVPDGYEHFPPQEGERELGYWIGLPFWNRGLTTEAVRAYVRYCGDVLKLRSLMITVNRNNVASQRVAVKCGFIHFRNFEADGIPSRAYRLIL